MSSDVLAAIDSLTEPVSPGSDSDVDSNPPTTTKTRAPTTTAAAPPIHIHLDTEGGLLGGTPPCNGFGGFGDCGGAGGAPDEN